MMRSPFDLRMHFYQPGMKPMSEEFDHSEVTPVIRNKCPWCMYDVVVGVRLVCGSEDGGSDQEYHEHCAREKARYVAETGK